MNMRSRAGIDIDRDVLLFGDRIQHAYVDMIDVAGCNAEHRSRLRGRTDCGPSAQMRIEAKAFIELVAAFSTLSITSDIPPNEVR